MSADELIETESHPKRENIFMELSKSSFP